MIVMIAAAVMSVFLHTETDQIARKTPSFFSFKLGIFWGKLGKKEDILDWEWGRISDPGDREKRPWNTRTFQGFLVIFQADLIFKHFSR